MVGTTLLVVGIVATVLSLIGSAFFSSSEIAIFSSGEAWVQEHAARGDVKAQRLAELREDPHRLLVTLLVGNNVLNIAIGSILTAIFVDIFTAGTAVLVATLVSSFLVLMFGEIVPKSWGLSHAKQWAGLVAFPIWVAEILLTPLVAPLDWVTGWINGVIGAEKSIEEPLVPDERGA